MRMQYVVAVAVLALGSMAAGCGDDPADQTRTYYYKGTNTTRSPDGQVIGTGETLLRRVFDGPNSQIFEHVITKDAQGIQENTLTFAVTGATFKEDTTGFTGSLTGEPWEWTAWTARGTLPNGLMVESTTTIDPDNVTVDMKFRNSEDVLQFTLKHEVAGVPQADFEQTRADWRPR